MSLSNLPGLCYSIHHLGAHSDRYTRLDLYIYGVQELRLVRRHTAACLIIALMLTLTAAMSVDWFSGIESENAIIKNTEVSG